MLNEVDIAEYMEELDNEKMLMVFRLLPKDIAADVFSYMDADQRQRVIEAMDDNEAVRLVDDMFIDDAVDFLEELPAGVVKRVLKGCDAQKRALINQFLRYPENSAGSIMTIEYMELHVGTTVGEAMRRSAARGWIRKPFIPSMCSTRRESCWARWRCASCFWPRTTSRWKR